MRSEGRQVKEGEQAMKWEKMRATTIGRMREVELMREGLRIAGEQAAGDEAASGTNAGGSSSKQTEEVMQGLYALSQTERYVPEPVVNVSSRSNQKSVFFVPCGHLQPKTPRRVHAR
ncbi:hypothetical protein C8R47DRAFT_1159587 [Mycena vitilis]|nr:hypothetical protein C8R47DRAFT_1159587 [Mycena vitilis]